LNLGLVLNQCLCSFLAWEWCLWCIQGLFCGCSWSLSSIWTMVANLVRFATLEQILHQIFLLFPCM